MSTEPEHQAKAAPRLLTEAEFRELLAKIDAPENIVTEELVRWRERGLIAQKPVDPLLAEARKIAASYYETVEPGLARNMRGGFCDDQPSVVSALAALRRGMELGRDAIKGEG